MSPKWGRLPGPLPYPPPSSGSSVSFDANSVPCRGEQCGGCQRSSATDRPHSFHVVLTERPSLELSAENEEEMADWIQYLCQAVSQGVKSSSGLGPRGKVGVPADPVLPGNRKGGQEQGPLALRSSKACLALLRTQVIPQGVAPAPCVPCCLVLTEQKLFTCHEDCQTSFFRSLATAELAEVASVSTEPGREYCLLVSFQEEEEEEEAAYSLCSRGSLRT